MPAGVQLARLWLPDAIPALAAQAHLLDPAERERAAGFRFERDRLRFVATRVWVRQILAARAGLPPQELRFVPGPHGKPCLAESSIRFNLSHSAGLALLAVTRDREVGVDVERIRAEAAREEVAERFFAPGEIARLRLLAAPDRVRAFFRLWTLKEAWLKARGVGLEFLLAGFDVSKALDTDAPIEVDGCRLAVLECDPGYAAGLAVEEFTSCTGRGLRR